MFFLSLMPPLVHHSALFHLLCFSSLISLLPSFFSFSSFSSIEHYFLWSDSICFFTLPLCILTPLISLSRCIFVIALSFPVSICLSPYLSPSVSISTSLPLPLILFPHYLSTHTWFILHITEAPIILLCEGKILLFFFFFLPWQYFPLFLSGCLFFPNSYTVLWIQS